MTFLPDGLAACIGAAWTPAAGSPPLGGLLVAAMQLVAVACAAAAARRAAPGRGRRCWIVIAGLVAALALARQLDLQVAISAAGRCHAELAGWYAGRRMLQGGLVAACLVAMATAILAARTLVRGATPGVGLAAVGVILVAGHGAIRAVDLHQIDALLSRGLGGGGLDLTLNRLAAAAGLALICLGALRARRRRRPTDRH